MSRVGRKLALPMLVPVAVTAPEGTWSENFNENKRDCICYPALFPQLPTARDDRFLRRMWFPKVAHLRSIDRVHRAHLFPDGLLYNSINEWQGLFCVLFHFDVTML